MAKRDFLIDLQIFARLVLMKYKLPPVCGFSIYLRERVCAEHVYIYMYECNVLCMRRIRRILLGGGEGNEGVTHRKEFEEMGKENVE